MMPRYRVTETVIAYVEAETREEANDIFAHHAGDFVGSHNRRIIVEDHGGGDKLRDYLLARLSGEDCTVPDNDRAGVCADFKQAAIDALTRGTSMSALGDGLTEVQEAIEKGYL
jgi:hypothetical protein